MKQPFAKRYDMALLTIHFPNRGEANFLVKKKSYADIKKYINRMLLWNDYEMEVSELGLFEYVLLKNHVINLTNKFD